MNLKNEMNIFCIHTFQGYRLAPDGRTCIDIDECSEYQELCIGNCLNEPGSYKCACPQVCLNLAK